MYRESDPNYVTADQQKAIGRIAALSDGFSHSVAVGLRGINYVTTEQLQDMGLVVMEWSQYSGAGEAGSIGNAMGWRVRLTDSGINLIRSGLNDANSYIGMEGDPTSGDELEVGGDVPVTEGIMEEIRSKAGLR
jgi:hypothetical protein